jgi:hypothetical protein
VALLLTGVRGFARRRRTVITVIGSLLTAAALVVGLAGRWHEFSTALASAALPVLAGAALLRIVALLARTEVWHLSIEAAGGSVPRRILYRASSMQPVIAAAAVGTASAGLRHLALRKGRELWRGLAVLRSVGGGGRVIAGAAAAVLILASRDVAAAAAAGLLMTVTGTIGGLCFAAWSGGDKLWVHGRGIRSRRQAGGSS